MIRPNRAVAATALLILACAAAITPAAQAAPAAAPQSPRTSAVAPASKYEAVFIKASAEHVPYGQSKVKLTITASANMRKAKGKVTVYDGAKKLKTLKLKKGKATYTTSSKLAAKIHTFKAKFAKRTAKVKVTVHKASLKLDQPTYTVRFRNYVPVKLTASANGAWSMPQVRFFTPANRPGSSIPDQTYTLPSLLNNTGIYTKTYTMWWLPDYPLMSGPATYHWDARFEPYGQSKVQALAGFDIVVLPNTLSVGSDIMPGTYQANARPAGPLGNGKSEGTSDCSVRIEHQASNQLPTWYRISGGQTATQFTVTAEDKTVQLSSCYGEPVRLS